MFRARFRQFVNVASRIGYVSALNKLVLGGLSKRIRVHAGYLAYAGRYSQRVIFFASLPKSGSTWIGDMFASLPGFGTFSPVGWHLEPEVGEIGEHSLYPGVFSEFKNRLAVVKGHSWGTMENCRILRDAGLKYFITTRDPRDTLISEYWYIRMHPGHIDYEAANRLDLSQYISWKLESGLFNKKTLDWIRGWLAFRDPAYSMILDYAQVVSNPAEALNQSFAFIGISTGEDLTQSIIKNHAFERMTKGRARGIADSKSVVRRGVPGEWKEVFTPENKRIFHAQGEDVIRAMGYEATPV